MAKTKYKQVKINFKPSQFEQLEKLAEAKGITKAEWIRQKIGAKIDEEDIRAPKPKPKEGQTDTALLYELHKIGNNINQLARHANTQNALDRQILSELVRIEDRLKTLL